VGIRTDILAIENLAPLFGIDAKEEPTLYQL